MFDVAIIGGLGHVGLPLGIAFAGKGKKVLLIDADLRKAQLHYRLGLNNIIGLSNLANEFRLFLLSKVNL